MRPGGENTPEMGLIIQICVKAPVRFDGLGIFKIEVAAETASAAASHILPAITHAALTTIGTQVDDETCGGVKVQIV